MNFILKLMFLSKLENLIRQVKKHIDSQVKNI
jgi:hypothetical protein